MKHLLAIFLFSLTCHAADVHLGRLQDLTWGGSGVDRVASFAAQGGDVLDGLVARWDFEEGTGTNVADNVGTSDGILTVGASGKWTNGISGGGYYFDGASYVTLPISLPSMTNAITFCAWVRSDTPNFNGTIFSRWIGGVNALNCYTFLQGQNLGNAKIFMEVRRADGTQVSLSPTNIMVAGAWTFVALTADSTNMSYFHNGYLSIASTNGTGPLNVVPGTAPFIGKLRSVDTLYPYRGTIDKVELFNRALTASEIEQIWNLYKP